VFGKVNVVGGVDNGRR